MAPLSEKEAEMPNSTLHDMANTIQVLGTSLDAIESDISNMRAAADALREQLKALQTMLTHTEAPAKHKPLLLKERFENHQQEIPKLGEMFGIEITLTSDASDDCAVYSDDSVAKQVIQKIVENAAKGKATEVRIHYQELPDVVEITFADNGRGMTDEQLYRLGLLGPDTGEASGGKGANMIRRLVDAAGGVVTWQSKVGVGTWVAIRLRKVVKDDAKNPGST